MVTKNIYCREMKIIKKDNEEAVQILKSFFKVEVNVFYI